MKNKKYIKLIIVSILIYSISLYSCNPNRKDLVKCSFHENYILEIKNKNILICANQNDDDTLLTEITIYNTLNDSIIFDTKGDAASNYSIKNDDNGLSVYSHVYFPFGNNFKEIIGLISAKTVISIDNNETINLSSYNIFNYPELSISQIDSIYNICNTIDSIIKNKDKIISYPLPYETLFLIFIGAHHQIGDAHKVWIQLPEYFEFDGAASETLSELENLN